MTPLAGFAPDADPTTPGVIVECAAMVPTDRGIAAAPSPITPPNVPVLPAACIGAAAVRLLGGQTRVFAATSTQILELSAGAWNNVSRSGGYTSGPDTRVQFEVFGQFTIATNFADKIQASQTGAFADIASAPKALIVVAASNAVMALNCDDPSYGTQADRWHVCAQFDHTSWAPNISTGAATGRLVGAAGAITAGARVGQQWVAFKRRAMFLGTYVGGDTVVQWQQVTGDVGCVGPAAVTDVNGALVFVGDDNFYLFDGVRPVAIANGQLRQWFFDNVSLEYIGKCAVNFDQQNNRVYIHYPNKASTSGQLNACLIYHLVSKQWGVDDRVIQATLQFTSPGITWDELGTIAPTWDQFPNVAYDSQFWLKSGRVYSVINSAGQLVQLTGDAGASFVRTGYFGEDENLTQLTRVRARFLKVPASSTIEGLTARVVGEQPMQGASSTMYDGRYDLRQTGRWHSFVLRFVGNVEISGIEFTASQRGRR